ncbi:hypothetical protein WMY93_025087 [Mugilogobius chulae]|uniref:Cytochrome P450 2K1-like n=1 Tax=Mugilogobius chulae TaxID=88201 RepID=A0AAW0NCG8_9GOBI
MELAGLEIVSAYVPVLISLVIVGLLFHIFSSATQSDEPPGPRPLPLLGNLLMMEFSQPDRTYAQLAQKYGPVFTFHMGPKKMVVIVGHRAVREALVDYSEEFGERDVLTTVKESNLEYGIIFANGEKWREMRRFALTNLRDFGMGKKACEDKIREESSHLVHLLKSFRGEPFDTNGIVNASVSNIICSMVFGKRFEYDDPEFKAMVYRACRSVQLSGTRSVQLYQVFPSIGRWISKARAEIRNNGLANRSLHTQKIDQSKKTLDPHMSRGFIDSFLIKQQQLQAAGGDVGEFHSQNLLAAVGNMFVAGTETTSSTLRWILLYMAKYPHIQDQVREEIMRVIGAREVQCQDRKDLPYTDAVIHETQRLGNIVPLNLPHRTSRDVTFRGYFIKKGTPVIPVLASVLYDESEWEKPHEFHPAHFLDKEGKFKKRDAFMPFSAGRRACVGESLARMELFLFFVTLMQNFRFTAPAGVTEEELDLGAQIGTTRCPKPHKLCAVSIL